MRNIAKQSAASRKAWRTRKTMAQARMNTEIGDLLVNHPDEKERLAYFRHTLKHEWPAYMKRALPCPAFR